MEIKILSDHAGIRIQNRPGLTTTTAAATATARPGSLLKRKGLLPTISVESIVGHTYLSM